MRYWILASRPKTLIAGIIPVILGWSLGAVSKPFLLEFVSILILGLLVSLCIQISTNLFNDAIDFKKGTDTKKRLGPPRAAAEGHLSPTALMKGGVISLSLACVFGLPLVVMGGWPCLLIGLVSCALAYLYTGSRFSISYLGLGEPLVILFFGIVPVVGLYYLVTESISVISILVGTQIGFLATVLIAINNFRDQETDKISHKNTIAVRFGAPFMKKVIYFLLIAPYILNIFLIILDQRFLAATILSLVSFPLAFNLLKEIQKAAPNERCNLLLAKAAKLEGIFGILMFIGIWYGFR